MKVLVTGGTGFIGRRLCAALAQRGDEVRVLTRAVGGSAAAQLPAGVECRALPVDASGWIEALSGCHAIVNLAGESIATRWSEARKHAIYSSRIETTRHLVTAAAALHARGAGAAPRVLVSASGAGYYGAHGDEPLDEKSPPGDDFLARVCVDWEAEARRGESVGLRVVCLRIGVVLGEGGGALASMVLPFRLFAGGPLGSGRQWMSWIHGDDVVGLALLALDDAALTGPMNATAPDPRTMRDFCRALGAALHRPSWAPVPAFALRLALGEMAEMLLHGQRVLPAVAQAAHYEFRRPRLEAALRAVLQRE